MTAIRCERWHGISPRCSHRPRKECGRCRSPMRARRETAAGLQGPQARRGARAGCARACPLAGHSRFVVVLEHPGRQRRAKHRRRNRIDRDAVLAPLAPECPGESVGRGLGGAVGGVAGRMAELAARGGHEHDLAAAALCDHPPAEGATRAATRRSTLPCMTFSNRSGDMSTIGETSFRPEADDQNVETAERDRRRPA